MGLSWFDASEAKKFGEQLAQYYMERIPLEAAKGKGNSPAKQKEVLDKMFMQLVQFRQQHKLNVYKKAQFGNTFKWTLNDAGYEDTLADELTKALLKFL